MRRSYELGRSYQHKGDRFAVLTIVLAFASSAAGFITALADSAILGVIPGVLAAGGGAIAAWVRRGHYDSLAAANREFCNTMQRELREFDARTGPYDDVPGMDAADMDAHRFRLFVNRCEQMSLEANKAAYRPTSGDA